MRSTEEAPSQSRQDPTPPKLSILVVGTVLTVAVAACLAYIVFLWVLGQFGVEPFEAARTAVTLIGVPTAAGAVFVALRNLRLKERQEHTDKQRLVDAQRAFDLTYDVEHTRRRIDREAQLRTRYVSAAEQIGNASAAVRIAGVNAMAQLADDWKDQRQACVDVLCAYLRLPPIATPAGRDEADAVVRRTVQQLIVRGVKQTPAKEGDPAQKRGSSKWGPIEINLRGATLVDFHMAGAHAISMDFTQAVFEGYTHIVGCSFTQAVFAATSFKARATFRNCTFARASFYSTFFADVANFSRSTFEGATVFEKMDFQAPVVLRNVTAARPIRFRATSFDSLPTLVDEKFHCLLEGCSVRGVPVEDSPGPDTNDGNPKIGP